MITSPFVIDRIVREATARLARGRRALRAWRPGDELPANPLAPFRSTLGKETFVELASVPDPLLVAPLRLHLAKLTLARVLWDDEVRVAAAWAEPGAHLDEGIRLPRLPAEIKPASEVSELSARTLLAAVLVDPDDVRRRRVAGAFERAARERLRDPVRYRAERRAAAAAQLGVSLDAVELPAPASAIEAAAAALLAATAPLAERFAPWDRGLSAAMARAASSGWPARLHPRWVLSVFHGTELGRPEGLGEVALPPVLGAASFSRALAAFGEAFGEAAAPHRVPFALARPAVDLRPLRVGALLGGLAGESVFARRTLELGAGASLDHARAFAKASAARLRLAAAAMRARSALYPPSADIDDRFCEATASAWGEPLPPAFAGVLPRVDETSPARFTAELCAALDRKRLVETLDEDWYRNPRAAEALRALVAEPQPELKEETLREAAAELGASLCAAAP